MHLAAIIFTIAISAWLLGGTAGEASPYKSVACDLFTNENAVRILGPGVKGVDGGMEETADQRSWRCTFSAATEGEGKGPKLHFMVIKHTSEDAARKSFDDIRQSNKSLAGYEEMPRVGDEAIVHSDGSNFQLVIVRKGDRSFRIKVNPSHGVILDNVKAVASALAHKLEPRPVKGAK